MISSKSFLPYIISSLSLFFFFENHIISFYLQEVEKRDLQVAIAGIPKTIDNDIAVCSINL